MQAACRCDFESFLREEEDGIKSFESLLRGEVCAVLLMYHLSPQAIVHVVALEQEGLLSQRSAETALKLLRKTQFP